MAKVTVKLPEDLLIKFSKLASNSDAVAQKVLEAGGEVVGLRLSAGELTLVKGQFIYFGVKE